MKRTVQSLRKLKIFRVGTYKYRSNSNDGRSEAYLWFSVSYLQWRSQGHSFGGAKCERRRRKPS